MLHDYLFGLPMGLDTYGLHQFVAHVAEGDARPLWRMEEGALRVRSSLPLGEGQPVAEVGPGLYLFDLVAAVCRRDASHRIMYPPSGDRPTREEWLHRQGVRHGFDVLSVRIRSRKDLIDRGPRSFALDDSHFLGVLRVNDPAKFNAALRQGIGRVGKAFGRGLMTVERVH
jgi:hypothetical protein